MKSANGKNRGARLVLILLAVLLAGMSLREKVCQMLIVAPTDLEPRTVRTVEPEMEEALAAYPVGGIFFSADNMTGSGQVEALLAEMQALSGHYDTHEIVVRAVEAGVDMLLCPEDLEAAVDALTDAVSGGALSEARIDESVLRILTLKERQGLLP